MQQAVPVDVPSICMDELDVYHPERLRMVQIIARKCTSPSGFIQYPFARRHTLTLVEEECDDEIVHLVEGVSSWMTDDGYIRTAINAVK